MITIRLNKKAGKILKTADKMCDEDIKVVPVTENVTITPNKTTQTFEVSSNASGIGKVVCNPIPSQYTVPSGTLIIRKDGLYDISNYSKVYVSASGAYRHIIKVGEQFSYDDPDNVYGFVFSNEGILEYSNDGGVVVFTGIAPGETIVTVEDSEIIDEFKVLVIAADTGYTVTINGTGAYYEDMDESYTVSYSIDGGNTWVGLEDSDEGTKVPNVKTIKLRTYNLMGMINNFWYTGEDGNRVSMDVTDNSPYYYSEEIAVTSDMEFEYETDA